jgi:hypothetical protein
MSARSTEHRRRCSLADLETITVVTIQRQTGRFCNRIARKVEYRKVGAASRALSFGGSASSRKRGECDAVFEVWLV